MGAYIMASPNWGLLSPTDGGPIPGCHELVGASVSCITLPQESSHLIPESKGCVDRSRWSRTVHRCVRSGAAQQGRSGELYLPVCSDRPRVTAQALAPWMRAQGQHDDWL